MSKLQQTFLCVLPVAVAHFSSLSIAVHHITGVTTHLEKSGNSKIVGEKGK